MTERTGAVAEHVDAITEEITAAADAIWGIAEPGLAEHRSAAYLKEALERHDFVITHEGLGGMPTAFVAEFRHGTGGRTVGILAEYDALPGLGNAAVPRPEPGPTGVETGHGCGHNLIGAGAFGAAVAVRDWLAATDTPGTVRLYGCPAEENWSGKVPMAREGVFADLDAALHWHPLDRALVANIRTTAVTDLMVTFLGRTAHAGTSPWDGRSALHALELFSHGLNVMREHLQPTARVHYLPVETGLAVNVVPDRARIAVRFRDVEPARVTEAIAWIHDIAAGAALATRTSSDVTYLSAAHDILPNTPLAERAQQILEAVGVPEYDADELAFARGVQRESGLPETGMHRAIMPLPPEPPLGGSSDVGDVSKIAPTTGFVFPTMAEGISLHTWAATACHGTSIGHKGALCAARALAALCADVLTDDELAASSRADHARRMAGATYASLLPDGFTGLPDELPLPRAATDEFVHGAHAV